MFHGLIPFLILLAAASLSAVAGDFVLDPAFRPVITRPANVVAVDTASNGITAIHGVVHAINGVPAQRTVRLLSDGSPDQTFHAPLPPLAYSSAFSVLQRPEGKILIRSCEIGLNRPSTLAVRRLLPDGALDNGFTPFLVPDFCGGPLFPAQDDKVFVNFDSLIRLNNDGMLDSGFAAPFVSTPRPVVLPDGKVLLGGLWQPIEGVSNNLARLNADGSLDPTFQLRWAGTNESSLLKMSALVATADGKVLVSDSYYVFLEENGENVTKTIGRVFRFNPDGTEDVGFHVELDGQVTAITPLPDGRILIGGSFTRVNGVQRLRVARLHSDGSLDESFATDEAADREPQCLGGPFAVYVSFDPLITGWIRSTNQLADPVKRLTVLNDGRIQAHIAGSRGMALLKLQSNGALDADYHPTIEAAGQVGYIFVQRDGRCVIWGIPFVDYLPYAQGTSPPLFGGWQFVNGQVRPGLARILQDGSLDASFATNLPPGIGSNLVGIAEAPDGGLLLWGSPTNGGTPPRSVVLRVAPDGRWDESFSLTAESAAPIPPFSAVSPIGGIHFRDGNTALVWGNFSMINGTPRRGLIQLHSDGTIEDTVAMNGSVTGVLSDDSGRLIIWGDFTSINGQSRGGMARLEADGTLDAGFSPAIGGSVSGVIATSDGAFAMWGEFTNLNNVLRNRIAELSNDGSLRTNFNPGAGPNQSIQGIRAMPNGELLVWGSFNRFGSARRGGLMRLRTDGSFVPLDAALEAYGRPSGTVKNILTDARGGAVIVLNEPECGTNGCRWFFYMRPDGSLDPSAPLFGDEFGLQANFGRPHPIVMDPQGRLLVAGEFSNVNGQPRFSLARFLRAPALVSSRFDTAGFRASIMGHAGQIYRVERSSNLVDWMTIGSVTNQQSVSEFVDPSALTHPSGFYRALMLSQ